MNKKLVEWTLMGPRGWNGLSMGDILGAAPSGAGPEQVRRLGWKEVMQLFHAAQAPALEALDGEYKAQVLEVGRLSFLAKFITHNLFGPGRWEGKAFKPLKRNRGWGYNIFLHGKGPDLARTRRMNTRLGVSNFDGRDSYHLNYSVHNKGFMGQMHDELRQINPNLFIGLGFLGPGGGPLNPAPFVVYGKPSPWVGPD